MRVAGVQDGDRTDWKDYLQHTRFVVIISAIAELERNLIIERVRAGMRRAKLEGRHIGRRPLEVDRAAVVRSRIPQIAH